jgi:hypothetical protein
VRNKKHDQSECVLCAQKPSQVINTSVQKTAMLGGKRGIQAAMWRLAGRYQALLDGGR